MTTLNSRGRNQWTRILLALIGVGGVLIPAAIVAGIVLTHGENTVSNDYVRHINSINRMLSGHYHVRHYFRDTFLVGSHSTAIPFLFHLLNIAVADWHVDLNLAFGVVIGTIRALVLVALIGLGWRERGWKHPWHWLAALPISMLVFSLPQISTYFGREASLTLTLTLLGVVAAAWFVVSREVRTTTLVLASLSAVLATWSSGAGPFVWPALVVGMALRGYRSWRHFAAVVVTGVLAIMPYILYLDPNASSAGRHSERQLIPIKYLITSVGWPLVNGQNADTALILGATGVLLLLLNGVVFVRLIRNADTVRHDPRIPAVAMLFTFWILEAWAIAAFRGKEMVTEATGASTAGLMPWYTGPFMVFWIALVLLCVIMLTYQRVQGSPTLHRTSFVVPTATLALTALFVAHTCSSWRDKGPGIDGRSPMTAACLRDYRTAPPICEMYVFTWGIRRENNVDLLGSSLAKHELSVFGHRQTRTLQGDWVLDTVRIERGAPRWTGGVLWEGPRRQTTFDRLTLEMPARAVVRWEVPLPPRISSARLRFSMAPTNSRAPRTALQLGIDGKTRTIASGNDIDINLRAAHGKGGKYATPMHITLRATAALQLGEPRIDFTIRKGASTQPATPSPVEFDAPLPGHAIDLSSPTVDRHHAFPGKKPNEWILRHSPKFTMAFPQPICATPDTYFVFSMRVSRRVEPHAAGLFWRERGEDEFRTGNHVLIPVHTDRMWHDYRFALRQLSADGRPWKRCMQGMIFYPLVQGTRGRRVAAQIRNIAFVERSDPK